MHDDDNSRRELTNAHEDQRFRRAVLDHVIHRHPTHLRMVELVLEITFGEEGFEESDAIERAIRDLTGLGLLHCQAGLVMPTNAALGFAELIETD